jgi:hypothetical protein
MRGFARRQQQRHRLARILIKPDGWLALRSMVVGVSRSNAKTDHRPNWPTTALGDKRWCWAPADYVPGHAVRYHIIWGDGVLFPHRNMNAPTPAAVAFDAVQRRGNGLPTY